jgi:hypothetical protein
VAPEASPDDPAVEAPAPGDPDERDDEAFEAVPERAEADAEFPGVPDDGELWPPDVLADVGTPTSGLVRPAAPADAAAAPVELWRPPESDPLAGEPA